MKTLKLEGYVTEKVAGGVLCHRVLALAGCDRPGGILRYDQSSNPAKQLTLEELGT